MLRETEPGDATAATEQLIGQYVGRESVIQGLQWGLQLLSLVMLACGLLVAILLFQAGKGLHAPPDSGYS